MRDGVEGRILPAVESGLVAAAMRELCDAKEREGARAACLALRPRLSYEAHYERVMGIYRSRVGGR